MVLRSSGHEQEVTSLEGVSLAVVNQDASAADDDLDLVPCVRSLLVRRHGEGKLHAYVAPLQEAYGMFAGWTRDTRSSVGKMDHAATFFHRHTFSLLLTCDDLN